MKSLAKSFLANALTLWIIVRLIGGVKIEGDWQIFLLVTAGLFLLNFLVKPAVKLVFLPINLLTLNLSSLFLNAGLLFGLTKIIPQFKVEAFEFAGFAYQGFTVPSIYFNQWLTFLIAATIITAITSLLKWFFS